MPVFDAKPSRRVETRLTQTTPAPKPAHVKQLSTQKLGDPTQLPIYTQMWGSRLPSRLILPVQRWGLHDGRPLEETEEPPARHEENTTHLPDTLKIGVENLSGLPMDDVRVHYHSSAPARVQALAYAQGTDIHVGPGQEHHLPHEAWHTVQQKQGRVQPTIQAQGVPINNDATLEREADVMGTEALQMSRPAHTVGESAVQAVTAVSMLKVGLPLPQNALLNAIFPVQRIINVPTFVTQTPGTWTRPRKSVRNIDVALAAYHIANQAGKLGALDHLMQTIGNYIDAKLEAQDANNNRFIAVGNLLREAAAERPRVKKLDLLANAPHGAIAATLPATTLAPLSAVTIPELNGILAVGHIASLADLDALLAAAGSAVGAGTPALRLTRVLNEQVPPHTPAALAVPLAAKLAIDEKILRGRITGGVLGANQAPTAAHRNLIGGHSQQIQADQATYAVENVVNNPNATQYVTFRKLVRGDAAGFANDVHNNIPGNIVAVLNQYAQAGMAVSNNPPVFQPNFLANAAAALVAGRQLALAGDLNAILIADAQRAINAAAASAAAANVALAHNSATALRPFIDAVTDLHANVNAMLTAARLAGTRTNLPLPAVAAAINQLNAAIQNFELSGPVLSVAKRSTLPPAGMSEDDILRAGDQTAAVPATLIRDRPNNNNPPDNTLIETKHQLVISGVVWVAIKENVRFNRPPPPALPMLTGGQLSSSYPTNQAAIPPDMVHPNIDPEGFSTIP